MFISEDIASTKIQICTTADETISAIANICRKNDAKAWLFGSHAHGTALIGSDIDIAIQANDFDAIEQQIEDIDTIFTLDIIDLYSPYKKEIQDAWVSIA